MLPGAFKKLACQVVFALACVLSYLFEFIKKNDWRPPGLDGNNANAKNHPVEGQRCYAVTCNYFLT